MSDGNRSSSCNCSDTEKNQNPDNVSNHDDKGWGRRYALVAGGCLILWGVAYFSLLPVAHWLTYGLMGIGHATPLGAAVEFFFYDTAKILLLLLLMVYAVAWLRASLNVERVRDFLAGKNRGIGYLLGAGFGAVTPFCSCSSIPLFLGFCMARIPIGITMAFLITSPLINEVAVGLLFGLLGWKFTIVYIVVGMAAGIIGGVLMDAIRAERWLQPFLRDSLQRQPSDTMPGPTAQTRSIGMRERHAFARQETVAIVRRVWIWVLIGVGIGAALHGFVPEEWFTKNLGAGQWWSVPLSVMLGIPLYSNVTGIIPVMESLLTKGLPIGTTLAFCMSTVAASLPEILMLKQVMQWKLLAFFLGVLLIIFTLVGWLFNAVGPAIL